MHLIKGKDIVKLFFSKVECMSSGTYTQRLNYATNFNVPLLIHIVVCSSGLNNEICQILK